MEVFFDGPWSPIRGSQANCLGTGTHSSLDAFPRRLGGRDMGHKLSLILIENNSNNNIIIMNKHIYIYQSFNNK